jgi:hypothetical protein
VLGVEPREPLPTPVLELVLPGITVLSGGVVVVVPVPPGVTGAVELGLGAWVPGAVALVPPGSVAFAPALPLVAEPGLLPAAPGVPPVLCACAATAAAPNALRIRKDLSLSMSHLFA